MKKLVLLPLGIIAFIILIPIDLVRLLFNKSPLGMDIIEYFDLSL